MNAKEAAAKKMEERAKEFEKKAQKLDDKNKPGGNDMRTAASNLRGGAAALRCDGSDGKFANAVSAENWTRDKRVAGYVDSPGGNTMTINLGHPHVKRGGFELIGSFPINLHTG